MRLSVGLFLFAGTLLSPLFAQVQDVAPLTETTLDSARFDRRTGTSRITATVANVSGPFIAHVQLVVENIPAGVTLNNATGTDANGNPVVDIAPGLPPGTGAGVVLEFTNPRRARLDITTRALGDLNPNLAFGPQSFVRGAGAPDQFMENFSVSDATGPFDLVIANSGVSSAAVSVNAIEVFNPSDFNRNVALLFSEITLLQNNELTVDLRGQPGETLTVWIVGPSIAPPPTVPNIQSVVTPPPNAAGWHNTDVTVEFSCTPGGSPIVACTDPILVSAETPGQIVEGTAEDATGGTATTAVTVRLDKTPPVIGGVSPTDGSTVVDPQVIVSGTVNDALSGVDGVTCDGFPAMLAGSSFSCDLVLVEGPNSLLIEATDIAGNLSSFPLSLTLESIPVVLPQVTINSPVELFLTNGDDIVVSGTVDDPAATVEVAGSPAGSGGSFSATVPLDEGRNTITAVATNAAGFVGTATVQVIRDTTGPTVVIESPKDGLITAQKLVTVVGAVNDTVTGTVNGIDVVIECNGMQATVLNRAFILEDVPLKRGPNVLQCTATDRAGNSSLGAAVQVTHQQLVGQTIEFVSGNGQSAVVGSPLPTPLVVRLVDSLVVRLVDSAGVPVAGRNVTFVVSRGSGTVAGHSGAVRELTIATDSSGQASVSMTLGTRAGAGNHRVTASALGFVGEVEFCATALTGQPDKILAIGGENQRGVVEQPLPRNLLALVVDGEGNPVANVPVQFSVTQGGGALNGTPSQVVNTDDDGRAAISFVLGPVAGDSANAVQATVQGLAGLPATYIASGAMPGPPENTRISGLVLDNSNLPVPGATVSIPDTSLQTLTDEDGLFRLLGVPVGTLILDVDGSTSPRAETFPHLEFELVTVAGIDNTVGGPILIPAIDTASAETCGGPTPCTLTMASVPGIEFEIAPASVTFPDGSKQGLVSLTQVHSDKVPMPPPNGSVALPAWTLQPPGVRFDPPIKVTVPNTTGLNPGQQIEMFQFDHDLEEFVSVGPGTVSRDGSQISSDAGFGITKAGWGCACPPPPPPTDVVSPNPPSGCSGFEENARLTRTLAAKSISAGQLAANTVNTEISSGLFVFDIGIALTDIALACAQAAKDLSRFAPAAAIPLAKACLADAVVAGGLVQLAIYRLNNIKGYVQDLEDAVASANFAVGLYRNNVDALARNCPTSPLLSSFQSRLSRFQQDLQRLADNETCNQSRLGKLTPFVDIQVATQTLRTLLSNAISNHLAHGIRLPQSEASAIGNIIDNLRQKAFDIDLPNPAPGACRL